MGKPKKLIAFYEESGYTAEEIDFILSNDPFIGLGVAELDKDKSYEVVSWWTSGGVITIDAEPGRIIYPTLFRSPARAIARTEALQKEWDDVQQVGHLFSPYLWVAPGDEWDYIPLKKHLLSLNRFPGCPRQ